MDQAALNNVFMQSLLYYCDQQIPGRRYQMWGSDLATLYFDEDSNLTIGTWLPTDIAQPLTTTLLTYTVSAVTSFFRYNYQLPSEIAASQPFYKISEIELALIPETLNVKGYRVYNTTSQSVIYWDGTDWVDS